MNNSSIAASTRSAKPAQLRQWLRGSCIVLAAAAALLMFGPTEARAACGVPGNQLPQSSFKPAAFVTPGKGHDSVVGLWHVKFLLSDGSMLFQSTVEYNSDGLELEIADIPVSSGNACMGVWKQEGKTVQIYHVAWGMQNGNPSTYGIYTQTNTLSEDGNEYRGHFDLKTYDLTGKFLGEIQGTTIAHRVDFKHPFSIF